MDEYEYEEERAVVMVELQGVFDSDSLWREQQSFRILGLETEEPVFQIGNYIFSGQYEDSSGTLVFFDKPQDGDQVEVSPCVCKTDKKLTMQRVFLQKKSEESEPPLGADEPPDESSHMFTGESCSEVCKDSDLSETVRNKMSPLIEESLAKDECDVKMEEPKERMDLSKDETMDLSKDEAMDLSKDERMDLSQDEIICDDKQATYMNASSNGKAITEELQKKSVNVQNFDTGGVIVSESGGNSSELSVAQEADVLNHSLDASPNNCLQEFFHSPVAAAELSEAEDSNRSSDFEDLVIVSEIEGSNEASCDRCPSSLSSVVQEPVDSTEQMDIIIGDSVNESQSGPSCSASKGSENHVENNLPSPVTGVINSLVSAVQSNFSHTLPCSEPSIIRQMNIVDSASHLVREYSSRLSDSSLPFICDSASSSQVTKNTSGTERQGSGTFISGARKIENVQNDVQRIMNSGVVDSDSRNDIFQNEDVFEGEAMNIDVDGVNTTNSLPDAANCVTASDLELMESSGEVIGSTLREGGHRNTSTKVGSRVNSTVHEVSNEESSGLLNSQESEASTYRNSSYVEGPSETAIVKDSVDSTSNQVFYPDKSYDHFKSTSGIDSTTNETGDRVVTVVIDSPKNLTIASSSEVPNGSIDSTLNNFKTCTEEVDFEMREAKHTIEEVDVATVVVELSEVNHSIDSTSNEVRQVVNHSPRNDNVTESMTASSFRNNETIHPCEVTESCSEPSGEEKVNFEKGNGSNQVIGNVTFSGDENSSSCNVTESHIHDSESLHQIRQPSCQTHDSSSLHRESCSGENQNYLFTESVPLVASGILGVTESLDSTKNSVPSPPLQEDLDSSLCEVTESCTVRKGHSMRHSQMCDEPGPDQVVKLPEHNTFEGLESCTSSSKPTDLSEEDEQSVLEHVAELSRQIKIPPTAFNASSSKHVESVVEIGLEAPNHSAESSGHYEKSIIETNACNLSTDSISEVTESNMEAENINVDVVADVLESVETNSEMDQSGDIIEQHECQMSSDNNDSDVTKSFATSSSGMQHQVCDVTESEMDTDDSSVRVTKSSKLKKLSDVESCASTSEQCIKCEVTKSDEGLMYIVTEPLEENDSEVTASCSSNSNRYPAFDVTESEAEIKRGFHYVHAEPSEIDNARYSEPCVSSNGQSIVSESEDVIYIVSEPDETVTTDSYPSSSKEISESHVAVEEVLYVAADSPEIETINDPCSSSSSKPSFVLDSVSEMEIEDSHFGTVSESTGQCGAEVSESCSSSGNHGAAYSNTDVLYIVTEPSGQNEAEVTESCKSSNRPLYDIAESSAEDEEDVLYIITESPDAGGEEVSESCASSSERCESNANSSRLLSRPTGCLEQNNMEVSESCGSSKECVFNVVTESESEISLQLNAAPLSDQSLDHPLSRSDMDSSIYLVSDSTNVFNPASECMSEIVEFPIEVVDDDDSVCEVTESYIHESTCSARVIQYQNIPQNVPGESSTFAVSESSMSSKKVTSTASTEPSSSYVNVSSASDSTGRSATSVIVSSANNVISHSYQDSGGDMSQSEANAPSASEQHMMLHNTSNRSAENEVSDSFDRNPADSTGDNSSTSHNRQYMEQPSEGFDNSKLPSSTSN